MNPLTRPCDTTMSVSMEDLKKRLELLHKRYMVFADFYANYKIGFITVGKVKGKKLLTAPECYAEWIKSNEEDK